MVMASGNTDAIHIVAEMRQIRESWSSEERTRRAELSRRRQNQLLDLLEGIPIDPGHWAVGAPDLEDLRRMAG